MNEIRSLGATRAERVTKLEIDSVEACEQFNQELQPGEAVVTKSAWTDYKYPASKIYQLNEEGQLVFHGEIITLGAEYPFMGDELQMVDNIVVVFNRALGLGMSTAEKVEVINVAADEADRGRSLGGSTTQRFTEELLPMIARVAAGEHTEFDCMFI